MRRAIFVVLIACSAAPVRSARTAPALHCELRDYTILSAAPLSEPDPRSKIGASYLRGAELVVEARPGLTAEWLQLELSRHVEAAHRAAPTPDCPLDVDDAAVSVGSNGAGFLVRIRARDDAAATEILRRARGFVTASAR